MALIDYTDMEDEIKDAPEPKVLKAGTEVKVRITSVRTGTSEKNDADYFMPTLEVPDDPMVKEFNDFHWVLDREALTAKEFERAKYKFSQFVKCFGVNLARPFDPEEDLVGLEGWIVVGLRKSEEYGEQNTISKYTTPK